jgi:hypothetical protein
MTTEEKFKWLLNCKACDIKFNPGYGQPITFKYSLVLYPDRKDDEIREKIDQAYDEINSNLYYKLLKISLDEKNKNLRPY